MTNDTTRTMPTVEEISELADLVDSTCWGEESRHDAAVMLRTIADQMRKTEPVARAMVGYKLEWVGPNWGCNVAPGTLLYTTPLADTEDARRYRWLRNHFRFQNDSTHEIWFDFDVESILDDPECLDKTIDRAMKGN